MILQPAKEATPPLAPSGLVVQARVAPLPGWVVMARVIEALEVLTVLPPASWTVTAGWVVQTASVRPAAGLGGEGQLGGGTDRDVEGVARGPCQPGRRRGESVGTELARDAAAAEGGSSRLPRQPLLARRLAGERVPTARAIEAPDVVTTLPDWSSTLTAG